MKRNPLLGSILSACVCLLIATASAHHASAQTGTEGSLLTVVDGKPAPCPLKHTGVKAEITGFIARVTVTQEFENPFPDKIEAVYTFPLPQAAAVDDMTITIGDRVVKGKIMTREDAQKTYDQARASGQVAALLNQERPNIFTQSVANILPSQQIKVTISYVENLKYEAGSYEWSFPMVVGRRYIPGSSASPADTTSAEPTETVPDADRISPPSMPDGMRAGHDISLEMALDAGVPIVAFKSSTHEIEALQSSPSQAVVRLKDQATIPNKDFVLKYDVAGSEIQDALLTHRRNNEGYFTFILQPPQRVTVADVTPKELVFVLDTSGSMSGFPIEKAKETMMLAIDGLYPQDTFNLILFSGDTRILFSDPQPATPQNIKKAKKVLAGADGNGGTEMMKAIRAALEPSDAQDHVRITCFMTDGQVGDDLEIIAEVQKHPKARVFAMGFGSSPNRFLLDKITEYGRGEVEYVTENGDATNVAQRFHERIRNPLLTDVSVEWNGLPVKEIYPRTIPDLFSAKPVILSGRYTGSGKGILRLKGKMSGSEFSREIPVELPAQEDRHDVLATLWARTRVDDLMAGDMAGIQRGKMKDELKTEITQLGLSYRIMTQFTSFVAVEDRPGDGIAPRRVDVPVEASARTVDTTAFLAASPGGGVSATVTVTAMSADVDTASVNLGQTVTTRSIQNLPINGGALQGLVLTAPGTVAPAPADPTSNTRFNVAINGQRAASNNFIIDGVSGSFGVAAGGQSPGASASGSAPPLTANGSTSPLAVFGAIDEVTIQTQAFSAEYGRNTGGVISVVTKAGTNSFHGSAFTFFNDDALNANDWFANSRRLAKPAHGLNEFGGTFGGPIQRDKTFFFASYEGLRSRQPVTSLSDVPSLAARLAAAPAIQPLLNWYPLPNGPARPDGFAELATSFANRARHDTAGFRVDRNFQRVNLHGYYNFTDSRADERGGDRFSVNTLGSLWNRSHSVTASAAFTSSPRMVEEFRLNYSHFTSRSMYRLDNFGSATLPPQFLFDQTNLLANNNSFSADLNGLNTVLMSAANATNTQRQLNLVGAIGFVSGNHNFKFGADYRRLSPVIGLRDQETSALFDGVTQASVAEAARLNFLTRTQPQRPIFDNFSAYAQDEWRVRPRLTFTYGLRWELNPAPRALDQRTLVATSDDDPAQLTLGAKGARLWHTTFANFAPRVGIAYELNKDASFVLRGRFGVLYDAANNAAGEAFADSYPYLNGSSSSNTPFPSQAPAGGSNQIVMPVSAFDPNLKLPYSLQWRVSLERHLGSQQVVAASYVAAASRRMLVTETLTDPAAALAFVRFTSNAGRSDYRALQLEFSRRFSNRFGATASYTWGKSYDDLSDDSAARALFRSRDERLERGPSDFDLRHSLTGFLSYDIPNPFAHGIGNALLRKWSVDSLVNVHSARPVNVVYAVPTSFGFLYLRPDVIEGAQVWISDPLVAAGRRINPNAFSVPADVRQGTLGRNALRGFGLSEVNLGLRRRLSFTDDVKLTLGLDALNVFNHPNFASPAGNDASLGTRFAPGAAMRVNPTFGQSFMNAARGPWAAAGGSFGAGYYAGGSRTLKLSVRFDF